jgi:hypothetical protein
MFDFDDPWWPVALLLLLCLWGAEIAIPVKAAFPFFRTAGIYADQTEETEDPQVAIKPLSILWPVLTLCGGGLLLALAFWRRVADPDQHARWDWLMAAVGLSLILGYAMLKMVVKTITTAAGMG